MSTSTYRYVGIPPSVLRLPPVHHHHYGGGVTKYPSYLLHLAPPTKYYQALERKILVALAGKHEPDDMPMDWQEWGRQESLVEARMLNAPTWLREVLGSGDQDIRSMYFALVLSAILNADKELFEIPREAPRATEQHSGSRAGGVQVNAALDAIGLVQQQVAAEMTRAWEIWAAQVVGLTLTSFRMAEAREYVLHAIDARTLDHIVCLPDGKG